MNENLSYIVNDSGKKTSVIVPFEEWEKINSEFIKIKNKLETLLSVKEGLQEISISKKSNKELQNLSDFLNESIS